MNLRDFVSQYCILFYCINLVPCSIGLSMQYSLLLVIIHVCSVLSTNMLFKVICTNDCINLKKKKKKRTLNDPLGECRPPPSTPSHTQYIKISEPVMVVFLWARLLYIICNYNTNFKIGSTL